jgi:serine phosphatase RsbU (regulator of sigma subunit)
VEERASWSVAREIQRSLLPRGRPELPGYTFWECYRPAQEVGGDLYDYIPVPAGAGGAGRWVVTVGDVAGKGVPAALLMASIGPEVRHLIRAGLPAGEALGRVNRHLVESGVDGRFVTLALVEIDPRSPCVMLTSAGHEDLLVRRAGGGVEQVAGAGKGPPLGAVADADYCPTAVRLGPGDVAVLHTDGATDAQDRAGRRLGGERFQRALAEAPSGVEGVGEAALAAVRDHAAGRAPFDDVTVVCFGRD